jgi:hypothetical protein
MVCHTFISKGKLNIHGVLQFRNGTLSLSSQNNVGSISGKRLVFGNFWSNQDYNKARIRLANNR